MSDLPVSPLAPATYPDLLPLAGVRLGAMEAGIKYKGRKDLMLAVLDEDAVIAGVFTKSLCPSAPVEWCRDRLSETGGKVRAIVVNSGNANAFTGKKGRESVQMTADAAAKACNVPANAVYLASTGVIGEPLDAGMFDAALTSLNGTIQADGWRDAAEAIMTTDTFPKLGHRVVEIDGVAVRLNGIAKGSGMIAPDMATMLSFLFTDAPIAADVLQALLSATIKSSFNAITVDSDTSTSDTVLLVATHKAAIAPITRIDDPRLAGFRDALESLLIELAQLVVKDGEGASKFVSVEVTGATSDESAHKIALSIANSPLVKTAIAGEDANWGRVVMAVGKAGEPADRDKLAIWFGDVRVAHEGERDPAYDEDVTSRYMTNSDIDLRADLGLGDGQARVWTCDLTHAYISINADYRS